VLIWTLFAGLAVLNECEKKAVIGRPSCFCKILPKSLFWN